MMPLFCVVGQILISAHKTLNDDDILNADAALKEYNHNVETFAVVMVTNGKTEAMAAPVTTW